MKKLLFTLVCALFVAFTSQASNAGLFSFNENVLIEEFAQVTELEEFIAANDLTLTTLQMTEEFQAMEMNLLASGPLAPQFSFSDIQWGSFAWGFCCWPIGIFTVLLNGNKDSDDRISYFIGLGTAILLNVVWIAVAGPIWVVSTP